MSDTIQNVIWKVSSRCNLNCSYCYVYNSGDLVWRRQPVFMSADIAETAATRVIEYLDHNYDGSLHIGLHGGEPLLASTPLLASWLCAASRVVVAYPDRVSISLQTNGTKLCAEAMELLRKYRVQLYVSLDGTIQINDRHRRDHVGRGHADDVIRFLKAICTSYRDIFHGILAVVDPTSDPATVVQALAQFNPPFVDFLLPLQRNLNQTRLHMFGGWLNRLFELYLADKIDFRIRLFEDTLRQMYGRPKKNFWIPYDPSQSIVIETNGEYHLDDTLRVVSNDFTNVGLSVRRDAFKEFLRSPRLRQLIAQLAIPTQCTACKYYGCCGSGLPAHRPLVDGRFEATQYCDALMQMYSCMEEEVRFAIAEARAFDRVHIPA